MKVYTALQMKAAEDNAAAKGTSYAQLMENAGQGAAQWLLSYFKKHPERPKTALLLCGKGNNAGDAFVIARVLAKNGWTVEYLPLCGEEYSTLAQENLQKLPASVKKVAGKNANFAATLLVDGVFGTGFQGNLPPSIAEIFHIANQQDGLRVALDIPSGLHCDTGAASRNTFKANYTLTFGAFKPALLQPAANCYYGEVQLVPIGLE